MIVPTLKDDELLQTIRASQSESEGLRLWWLGQSGFLVQYAGQHLLLDPYLSDSLTRKYAETDKPHIRMTEIPIAPQQLDLVDVITSSHNHTDHLDGETLGPLLEVNPAAQLIVPAANRAFAAARLQVSESRLTPLDVGQSVEASSFRVTAVPAAHEELERDEQGRYRFVGYVVECGPFTIYHSGDTLSYPDQEDYLRPFNIDVALLPINGRKPERRVAGNLDGAQAAQLAHDIQAAIVIPCHYEMFTFNTESPARFQAACERLGQPYQVLRCGETFVYQQSNS